MSLPKKLRGQEIDRSGNPETQSQKYIQNRLIANLNGKMAAGPDANRYNKPSGKNARAASRRAIAPWHSPDHPDHGKYYANVGGQDTWVLGPDDYEAANSPADRAKHPNRSKF